MGNLLTPTHLIIILLIVLVLFGRGRISEFMGDFGKGIKSFKKGLKESEDGEAEEALNPTVTRTIDAQPDTSAETIDTLQAQKASIKARPKKAAASMRAKTTIKPAKTAKAAPRAKTKP